MKFRGEYEHSLDEKGRTAMPSSFREIIQARGGGKPAPLILLRWLDDCLRLYLLEDWEAEEERFESSLDDLLDLDETAADIRRVLFSLATEVDLDGHNRILIRPALREHAGIKDAVVWVGQGRYLELWEPVRWRTRIQSALQDRGVLRQTLGTLVRRSGSGTG
ncbi:MAG: division/cell wall cluster transcriptional repressor MraZ [Bradymonadales bacterium]|nr:division/cell wall cluster transcriptional repressor MraZ [Bradymonadales bacterium]